MQLVDLETPKPKGGRPRKSADRKRTKEIRFYLSETEHQSLARRAEQEGMTLPDFLLCRCNIELDRFASDDPPAPPVPAVNMALCGSLAKLSSNLNQITRNANAGHFSDGAMVVSACYQLHREVETLRKQLRGVE